MLVKKMIKTLVRELEICKNQVVDIQIINENNLDVEIDLTKLFNRIKNIQGELINLVQKL